MTQPKQYIFDDDWISLQDAAKLMHVNEKDLRKEVGGKYVIAPNVARIRVSPARNAKILFSLAEILAWRAEMVRAAKAFAAAPLQAPAPVRGFDDLRDELRALNAPPRAMRRLGIRQ